MVGIRRLVGFVFLLLAISIAWQNLWWVFSDTPYSYTNTYEDGEIYYELSRQHIRLGDCVLLQWHVTNIRTVTVNGENVVEHDEKTICYDTKPSPDQEIELDVEFHNGTRIAYKPPLTFHNHYNIALPFAFLALGIAFVIAPLSSQNHFRNLQPLFFIIVITVIGLVIAIIGVFTISNIAGSDAIKNLINEQGYRFLDPYYCGYVETTPYNTVLENILFESVEELPANEGRVMIFGTSNARESYLPYELTEAQNDVILNLSIGASTPLEYDTVLRYLEQEKNILHPQEGQSAVVYAFWSAVFAEESWRYLHESSFRLYHRFYLNQPTSLEWSITPTNDINAPFYMAQGRVLNFFNKYLPVLVRQTLVPDQELAYVRDDPRRCRPVNPDQGTLERNEFWTEYHGRDYMLPNESTIPLENMTERILNANVPIIIIHVPIPSWLRERGENAEYREYMDALAQHYQIPVYDLNTLLQDDQFRDTAHLTINGRQIFTEALVNILQSENILP